MKVVVTLTKEFFKGHPRAGQSTLFARMVREGVKIHTCRDNAEYWTKKIEMLKSAGGTLCIREWSGKPYRSPQDTIAEIPAETVHVSHLKLTRLTFDGPTKETRYHSYSAMVNGKNVRVLEIANNDGFVNERDFVAFLDPLFDKYKVSTIHLAIIHFTDYKYTKQ